VGVARRRDADHRGELPGEVRLVGVAQVGRHGCPGSAVSPVGPLGGLVQRNLNVMSTPTPAADVAALLIAEIVLHGWDAAKASGQDYACRDDVAAAVLGAVEANAELFRQYQGFADPIPVPASASMLDQALALSGRDPGWRPVTTRMPRH
jgi:hypothetical protein